MSCYEAAVKYHSLGLHPIPCQPKDKRPLIDWKPYQERQPELTEVMQWWERWPDANVALVLGRGVFAVDLDGDAALFLLGQAGVAVPGGAPRVKTGKGYHVYLAAH